MNNELIPIFIPDEEAKKFLLFQEHYERFNILVNNGVFDIKNGSAVINFDAFGSITTIQRADMLYNRRIKSYPQT